MNDKRGLNHQQAMAYVGVKRRTFDQVWRPQLVAIRQGACLVFDRHDLDQLFEHFKRQVADGPDVIAAQNQAHNQPWNGRPTQMKGAQAWAKKLGEFTPMETGIGKWTSGNGTNDFASVALKVLKKRNAG